MQMLCEIPKGSDVFYGISTFYGKNAEAFKLLGIAPEFISFEMDTKRTELGNFGRNLTTTCICRLVAQVICNFQARYLHIPSGHLP